MEPYENCLSLTRKLISFNTVNPPGQEYDCAEYLASLLEDGGFKVTLYEFSERRTSLIAQIGSYGDKAPICFAGHMDTVPLGGKRWEKDPFSGEVDGDKVFGRGSSDMKGGLAAMVVAALRLANIANRNAGITLVCTSSEETGCQGAHHLARLGNALGEAGALLIGEPTSNYPLVGHKGALWLEVSTSGVTAHGSMPEQGENAIYKAAQVVTQLQAYKFDISPHPLLGAPTLNVGTISGGMNINSVPDRAVIGVDIRTIPDQRNRDVYENLQSYLGQEVEIERIVDAGSIITEPGHEWVQEVFDIMEPFCRKRPVARGVTYFTDASVLTPAFGNPPTLILGPGEPAMAHKLDEF
ncbi:MAG: M20 family metallopeptidase [Desulfobacterales bacterium]|nr:M20 family metallopeptidase [Desulfobacterales bacterium]